MAERLGILVINQISASGLSRLPAEIYRVGKEVRRRRALWLNAALATLLFAGLGLWLFLDRRVDRLDRPVPGQRLIDRAAGFGIDPRLQFPALAARGQFADQRVEIVAIIVMRAGQEGQPSVMLDDPVVVLGKAKLFERVVESAA